MLIMHSVVVCNQRINTVCHLKLSSFLAITGISVPDLESSESDITPDMLQAASKANRLPTLRAGETLSLSLSCLEIYNEQVFDVLAPPTDISGARPILKIKDGLSGQYVRAVVFTVATPCRAAWRRIDTPYTCSTKFNLSDVLPKPPADFHALKT